MMTINNRIVIMDNQKREDVDKRVQEYIESMNEKEKKAYEIAKDHLGMSYQVEKSIAFLDYCKKKEMINTDS